MLVDLMVFYFIIIYRLNILIRSFGQNTTSMKLYL